MSRYASFPKPRRALILSCPSLCFVRLFWAHRSVWLRSAWISAPVFSKAPFRHTRTTADRRFGSVIAQTITRQLRRPVNLSQYCSRRSNTEALSRPPSRKNSFPARCGNRQSRVVSWSMKGMRWTRTNCSNTLDPCPRSASGLDVPEAPPKLVLWVGSMYSKGQPFGQEAPAIRREMLGEHLGGGDALDPEVAIAASELAPRADQRHVDIIGQAGRSPGTGADHVGGERVNHVCGHASTIFLLHKYCSATS
jgi:hypothetical protein